MTENYEYSRARVSSSNKAEHLDEPAKNYGVDISTLARLVESGEL